LSDTIIIGVDTKGVDRMDLNEIKVFKTAILNEVEGEKYYRNAAQTTDDSETAQAFLHLAEDEQQHQVMLRELLTKLLDGKDLGVDSYNLQGTPSPHIFSSASSPRAGNGMEISVFHIAILMEKASIDFYRQAAYVTILPSAKDLFDFLVNWEIQHLEAMEKIYDALTEDWWDKQSYSPA
jgi:rubrerythrin